MSLANAFLTDQLHFNFLPWSQLGYQDVFIEGSDGTEPCLLVADGDPLEMPRVDVGILIVLLLIDSVVEDHGRVRVLLGALDMQLELDGVELGVAWVLLLLLVLSRVSSVLLLYLMILK